MPRCIKDKLAFRIGVSDSNRPKKKLGVAMKSEIPKAAGVYALIFNLNKHKTITFNRNGDSHSFNSGWYVYLGSARGVGGLRSRLTRHQRTKDDSKRMHWNVDYFREFADFTEMWFTKTTSARHEHNWAKVIASFPKATVPAQGFGASDCDSKCPAHFVHLPYRPTASLFRAALSKRKIRTRVSSLSMDDVKQVFDLGELWGEYLAGNQFAEAYRFVDSTFVDSLKSPSLANGTDGRALAETIAKTVGLSFDEYQPMIKLAIAVNTLLYNCGPKALEVIFNPSNQQSRKSILQLSRTSDLRQQFRVDQVLDGSSRTIGPQNSDSVFDTVSFGEVPSRLARARGSLNKLEESVKVMREPQVKLELSRLAGLIQTATTQLDKFVSNKPTSRSALKRLGKDTVLPVLAERIVTGKEAGQARLALRLTVKNVWDYPEMIKRKLLPTDRQIKAVDNELKEIRKAAKRIKILCSMK